MILKYLSQESDSKVLDLVKPKGFYPYKYMCDFQKFNETLPRLNEFYKVVKELVTKIINMFSKFGINLK